MKITALNKNFGDKTVLRDLNATFSHTRIYGIIGQNGAGKSTFFRCVCQLEKYKGTIIDDSYSPLRNHINYLPTLPYFYPKLTGGEYLAFFNKIGGKTKIENTDKMNALFKLPLEDYIETYSTGMKKKLAFFALVVNEKPIYILDEPFNGLDLDSVILFKNIILRLKEKGCLVFVSSHIISTLTDICDEIQLLKDGNLDKKYAPKNYDEIEADLSIDIKKDISEVL